MVWGRGAVRLVGEELVVFDVVLRWVYWHFLQLGLEGVCQEEIQCLIHGQTHECVVTWREVEAEGWGRCWQWFGSLYGPMAHFRGVFSWWPSPSPAG